MTLLRELRGVTCHMVSHSVAADVY